MLVGNQSRQLKPWVADDCFCSIFSFYVFFLVPMEVVFMLPWKLNKAYMNKYGFAYVYNDLKAFIWLHTD